MFPLSKKLGIRWIIALLALTLVVGCSGLNPPAQTAPAPQSNPPSSTTQASDAGTTLLLNMRQLAEKGKVLGSEFPVKTTVLEDVKKKWGEPDKTDWVPDAKGTYAAYASHAVVFGFNKGSQIFEVRSLAKDLEKITLSKVQETFGAPAYATTVQGEEIIGYTAGQEFKILLVFPQVTSANSDPALDHYSVLYPRGTVNSMAGDPGRQW